jgi:Ca2+-binding EF-hand superfamily protein
MKAFRYLTFAGLAAFAVPAAAETAGGERMMHSAPTTRAELESKIKQHFGALDTNRDGFVTKEEAAAEKAKMAGDMRDRHFKEVDTNADGTISRPEFDAAHTKMKPGGADVPGIAEHEGAEVERDAQEAKDAKGNKIKRGRPVMQEGDMFARADKNGDGKVSIAEALAGPLARFDAADTNHDGTLSPEERKAAREKMRMMMGAH